MLGLLDPGDSDSRLFVGPRGGMSGDLDGPGEGLSASFTLGCGLGIDDGSSSGTESGSGSRCPTWGSTALESFFTRGNHCLVNLVCPKLLHLICQSGIHKLTKCGALYVQDNLSLTFCRFWVFYLSWGFLSWLVS